MLQQTDKRLNEKINRYGCYLMSLIAIISDKNKYEFTADEIDNLYDCLLLNGTIDEDCYIMAPDTVLKFANKIAKGKDRVLQVGIKDIKGERFWNWVRGNKVDYKIGKYLTANGNTHFMLLCNDRVYDPNPKCTIKELLATIYYRVYNEEK
jgi:hypothetical protein